MSSLIFHLDNISYRAIFLPVMRPRAGLKRMVGIVVAALLVAPWLMNASVGALIVPPHQAGGAHFITPPSFPLFSDFDGDSKLDQAELSASGRHKSIAISLSRSWVTHLSFETETFDRGRLLAGDIDHDNDLDLVWVSQTQPHVAVVWLGDGAGNFERAKDQQAYAAEIGSLLGMRADSGISQRGAEQESACLSPPSSWPDLALNSQPDLTVPPASSIARIERRRGLTRFSSALHERGPPPRLS